MRTATVFVHPRSGQRSAGPLGTALATALTVALIVTAVAFGVAAGSRPASAAPPSGWEQDMANQVNARRVQAGAPPITLCAPLTEAARWQSDWMAAIDNLQHEGQGGSAPWDRSAASGYAWTRSAENVAATGGQNYDVSYVMGLWIASKGHDDNIIRPAYTHLGVGLTYSASDNRVYWTQVFGAGGSCAQVVPRPVIEPDGRFLDVQPGHPFRGDILWISGEGIADGYADRTFRGASPVSRQAMAAFLHRYAGSPGGTCDAERFNDVGAGDMFCGAITWLSSAGIAQGFGDGGFHPTEPVSRQAMAAFLYRFTHPGAPTPACDADRFNDVGASSPFCGAVTWLSSAGIAQGFGDGGFHPADPVSRQAMAAFLHRLDALA